MLVDLWANEIEDISVEEVTKNVRQLVLHTGESIIKLGFVKTSEDLKTIKKLTEVIKAIYPKE